MTFATFSKLLVIAASAPFNGWVLSWLWLWFIVPLGVVHLSITGAMGMILILALINWSSLRFCTAYGAITDDTLTNVAIVAWTAPAVAIAVGYVCYYLGTF